MVTPTPIARAATTILLFISLFLISPRPARAFGRRQSRRSIPPTAGDSG
jgi:hypothetical protein